MSVGSPLLRRVPARTRTVVAWCALVLSPVVLLCWLLARPPFVPAGLGHLVPIVALALSVGVLRRWPLVPLAVLLVDLVVIEFAVLRNALVETAINTVAIDLAVGYIAATRRRLLSVPAALVAFALLVVVAFARPVLPPEG